MKNHQIVQKLKGVETRAAFVRLAVLVFIGLHFFLFTSVSTGPNTDVSLPWMEFHRHGNNWTIGDFQPIGLGVVVLVSVLVTWAWSRMLRHRTTQ